MKYKKWWQRKIFDVSLCHAKRARALQTPSGVTEWVHSECLNLGHMHGVLGHVYTHHVHFKGMHGPPTTAQRIKLMTLKVQDQDTMLPLHSKTLQSVADWLIGRACPKPCGVCEGCGCVTLSYTSFVFGFVFVCAHAEVTATVVLIRRCDSLSFTHLFKHNLFGVSQTEAILFTCMEKAHFHPLWSTTAGFKGLTWALSRSYTLYRRKLQRLIIIIIRKK